MRDSSSRFVYLVLNYVNPTDFSTFVASDPPPPPEVTRLDEVDDIFTAHDCVVKAQRDRKHRAGKALVRMSANWFSVVGTYHTFTCPF